MSVNLFPQWSPLSLTGQRVVRQTDLDLAAVRVATKDRIDSFGANWVLNIRPMPRLVLNYQESDLKTDASGDFTTRSGTASTDFTMGPATRLAIGFQFSETETQSGTSSSGGGNVDVSSQPTLSLTVTGYARYVNTSLPVVAPVSPPSPVTPGISFFQERSYGTAVFYRPPLYWWDGNASYNYSENPFFNDFKTHSAQASANLRYNEKTDSNFGARYLHYTVTDSTVNSQSGNASLNYRPIFGLMTGVGGSVGLTSTQATGAQDTDSLFQNYQYNINYTKPWQAIQYSASYQLTYGLANTRPTGFSSRDLGNSVAVGLDNTNTRIVHVGLHTTYSDVQRVSESVKTEQSTYMVMLTADSSYVRNLIMNGDSLGLRAQANHSDTTGFGVEGRVESGELNAAYQTLIGLAMTVNYRIEDYPTELLLDRQIITGYLQYSTYLIMNMSLTLSVRDVVEDNRYREDVNRLEQSATVNHLIGKLSLGLQYLRTETRTSGDLYGTYSILLRASRTF